MLAEKENSIRLFVNNLFNQHHNVEEISHPVFIENESIWEVVVKTRDIHGSKTKVVKLDRDGKILKIYDTS